MTRMLVPVSMSVLLALGGCGGKTKGNEEEDTSVDTPGDSIDTGTDQVEDTEPGDTEPDTVEDTVGDTPEDSPSDTTTDTPGDGPTSGVVGDPCTEAGDCADTLGTDPTCLDEITVWGGETMTFEGGYCSAGCTDDGDECGDGALCTGFGGPGSPHRCFLECTDDADCRESEGYVCFELWGGAGSVCLPDMGGP